MRIVFLGLLVILGMAVQSTFFGMFKLPGNVTPDLVFIVVICEGLLRGSERGALFGFVAGLFGDFLAGNIVGIGSLVRMLTGFVAGFFEQAVFKENFVLPIIAVFAGTLIFQSLEVGLHIAFGDNYRFWWIFFTGIIPLAIYNTILAPVIYWVMMRVDSFLEERG